MTLQQVQEAVVPQKTTATREEAAPPSMPGRPDWCEEQRRDHAGEPHRARPQRIKSPTKKHRAQQTPKPHKGGAEDPAGDPRLWKQTPAPSKKLEFATPTPPPAISRRKMKTFFPLTSLRPSCRSFYYDPHQPRGRSCGRARQQERKP